MSPSDRRRGPRTGRTGRRGRVRRVVRATLWTFVGFIALGIAGVAVAYAVIDIPEPNDRAVAQASVIYYSDGTTEMDRLAKVNREPVELDQVPLPVQHAFVAAEDRSFYDNEGISPKGIVRAITVAISGGEQQGGSTITQQYVKNYFLTQDQTYTRKFKEVLISLKIDGELSKAQILGNYLNTIYFGRGADGIQTASQAYFGKDVEDLTLSEGAFLASVINAPSLYDPALGEEQRQNAEARWNYVLDGMVSQGWLTAAERSTMTFPEVEPPKQEEKAADSTGFITEMVIEELHERVGLTEQEIARGGFKIVTTIDKDAQAAAVQAVKEHRPSEDGTSDVHIGLAAVEPGDGAVRAMYGGAHFGTGPYGYFNAAVDGKMQAGSTMKPFTMIAALRQGMPLSTTYSGDSPFYDDAFIFDQPNATDIQRDGGIVNYGNRDHGPVDMREATKKSINTYYAQLNLAVTPEATAEAAEDAGVKAWSNSKQVPVSTSPVNVFGTDSVRVLDMANAYATISAQGRRAQPYFITSVTSTGERDFEYEVDPQVERVFDEDVARDAIHAMSKVASPGGTGYPTVARLDRPVAGKTGTTSGNYAAWFDGFTPGQLAAAVGMYRGDGRLVEENQLVNMGGYAEVTGGTIPAEIWTDFMIGALEGEPVAQLPPEGNVTSAPRTDAPSGAPEPITSTTQQPTPTSTRSEPAPTSTSPSSSSSSSTSTSTSSTSSSSTSSSSSATSSTSSSSSTTSTSAESPESPGRSSSTTSPEASSSAPERPTSSPPPATQEEPEPSTTSPDPVMTRPSTPEATRRATREATTAEGGR